MKDNEPKIQSHSLITPDHLRRLAVIYIRQSTEEQVRDNVGSTQYQRSLVAVAQSYGWADCNILIIDEDLGITGSSTERRTGWQRLQMMVGAKQVGAVFVVTISRMARQLIDFEVFRLIVINDLLSTALDELEGSLEDTHPWEDSEEALENLPTQKTNYQALVKKHLEEIEAGDRGAAVEVTPGERRRAAK